MAYDFLKKKNNAYSTLNGSMTNVATTLVVAVDRFPAANFMLTIWDKATYQDPSLDPNMEVVKVTGKAGTTFTVTRAQEGTAAVAHASGLAAENLWTKAQADEYEAQINAIQDIVAGSYQGGF